MDMTNQTNRIKAVALRKDGATINQIAETLGVTNYKVKYWLRRYNQYGETSLTYYARCRDKITTPTKLTTPASLESALAECARSPASIAFIARRYNVKYNKLYYAVKTNPDISSKRKELLKHS